MFWMTIPSGVCCHRSASSAPRVFDVRYVPNIPVPIAWAPGGFGQKRWETCGSRRPGGSKKSLCCVLLLTSAHGSRAVSFARHHPRAVETARTTRGRSRYGVVVAICAFPHSGKGIYPFFFVFAIGPVLVWRGTEMKPSSSLSLRFAKSLGRLSYPVPFFTSPSAGSYSRCQRTGRKSKLLFWLRLQRSLFRTSSKKLMDQPVRRYLEQSFSKHRAVP